MERQWHINNAFGLNANNIDVVAHKMSREKLVIITGWVRSESLGQFRYAHVHHHLVGLSKNKRRAEYSR